jgi:acetamidase/formamidase/AraC-like DNA-binding protein
MAADHWHISCFEHRVGPAIGSFNDRPPRATRLIGRALQKWWSTMNSWSFTTESYPDHRRLEAWQDVLGRLSIEARDGVAARDVFATAQAVESPLGIVFAQIAAGPQRLSYSDDPGIIWLALHSEGEAVLSEAGRTTPIAVGDLVYGTVGAPAELLFATSFRQLLMRIPRSAIGGRLVAPLAPRVGHLSGRSGFGRVFAQLLASVADTIDGLDADAIRPIEVALAEFLAVSLATDREDGMLEGATASQTATLHRLCQTIEMRLSDPDLGLAGLAQQAGVSMRYLQKLFEAAGSSFGEYVRQRRLERARLDLMNPLYARESITTICFRWGFNDAAGFSRAFSERFGEPPRQYRRKIAGKISEGVRLQMARGWPLGLDDQTISKARRPAGRSGRLDPVEAPAVAAPDGAMAQAQSGHRRHYLAATDKTVHWGYFSRSLRPVLEVEPGDIVTIETLTQHAYDDHDRMIKGDAGAESVFHWTRDRKNVDRRGAGPIDASIYGRGAGEGFGVHICTGPVAIKGAMPGDLVEVRILDLRSRPSANEAFAGRAFGSNAAAWWGFHYKELLTEPRPREVVTIYEVTGEAGHEIATAVYNFRWTPQTDPFGVVHATIDYPGVPVDHATIDKKFGVLRDVEIPVRPHFGVIGMAPRETEIVDSIPPTCSGGNIDNWRAGKGARLYLPVGVPGGLLSVGDPHASQGDSELCGTAIECSLTGDFQLILHKRQELAGTKLEDVNYPLLETPDEWVIQGFSHPNYLAELGERAQSEVYEKSSLDLAMKDAFRKARRFLMTSQRLSEDEAISLLSVAVDFGVTQVVDGNWGVHGVIRKRLFADGRS